LVNVFLILLLLIIIDRSDEKEFTLLPQPQFEAVKFITQME